MTTPEDTNKNNLENKEIPKVNPENLEQKEISKEELLSYLDDEENKFKSETSDEISGANSINLDEPTFEKVKNETNVEQDLNTINQEAENVISETKNELVNENTETISPELQQELNKLKFLQEEKIRLQNRYDELEKGYKENFQLVSKKELSWYESEMNSVHNKLDNMRYDIPNLEKKIETLKNPIIESKEPQKIEQNETVSNEQLNISETVKTENAENSIYTTSNEVEIAKNNELVKENYLKFLTQDFSEEKSMAEKFNSLQEKLQNLDNAGRLSKISSRQLMETAKDVIRGEKNLNDLGELSFNLDKIPVDINLKDTIRDLLVEKAFMTTNFDSFKKIVNAFDFSDEEKRVINEKLELIQSGKYVDPKEWQDSATNRNQFNNPYGLISKANEIMGLKKPVQNTSPQFTDLNNPPAGWNPNSRS